MIIWILFLSICYTLIIAYENPKASSKKKSYILLGLMIICVYFSTFRDGLGSDYTAYQSYCERHITHTESWLLMEPIPAFLYGYCYNTKISAVLFFLVTSLIVCVFSLWVYSKFKNFYISAFLFITYTNLYLASFNLVRQFTAASIILFATYYFVMKRKSPIFFIFVFFAFLWHKSAFLGFFIYFLPQDKFSNLFWIIAILFSWIAPIDLLFKIPIVGNVLDALNYLDNLSNTNAGYSRTSLSNIYMHFMLILCIANRSRIKPEDRNSFNLALKLSIISVIFCNISANSLPFAYRYCIFFSVFLPLLFSYLPYLVEKQFSKIIVFVPICVLLFALLFSNINDRVFCPKRILPIKSIYDTYYHPYENPDIQIIV